LLAKSLVEILGGIPTKNMPLLLIDFDPILYRAASTAETELEFNPECTVVIGDFKRGKQIVKQLMRELMNRFDTTNVLCFTTSKTNFRKTVFPDYKGNRVKRKPAGYLKLKNWAKDTWTTYEREGLEADDLLGVACTSGKHPDFILCSPDKDLQQFPVKIWNGKELFQQTKEAAVFKRWEQALTGDQTDGYPGARGIGPKRAHQLLSQVKDGDYWPVVRDAFLDAGHTEEDAITSVRLATILSADMIDSAGKPILFTP